MPSVLTALCCHREALELENISENIRYGIKGRIMDDIIRRITLSHELRYLTSLKCIFTEFGKLLHLSEKLWVYLTTKMCAIGPWYLYFTAGQIMMFTLDTSSMS
jgi:hypothetical protein